MSHGRSPVKYMGEIENPRVDKVIKMNRFDELEEIIEVYLTSFLCWDVLMFFCDNQGIRISAEELARALGQSEDEIYKVLDELARKGVLLRYFDLWTAYFELCEDEEINKRLGKLTEALGKKSFRLMIVERILQREMKEQKTDKIASLS